MNNTLMALSNVYGIARHRLKNVVVYTTDRCNSKCKTCFIWKKHPKRDMPVQIFEKIILDETSKGATFKITGGEFLLHPKYKGILALANKYGLDYQLFSNGFLADRLIEAVREFGVKELAMSCDGIGKKYKEIRGIDNFDNIVKIISALKDETNITLNYTISPFNTKDDLKQVISLADSQKVHLVIGVFNDLEYFDVDVDNDKARNFQAYDLDGIQADCLMTPKYFENKFIKLYNRWLKGEYKVPCLNMRSQIAVYPNGDIHLCEGKNIVLGNLNKDTLKGIWNDPKTIKLQKRSKSCNACFLTCQRPIDVFINSTPLRFFIK